MEKASVHLVAEEPAGKLPEAKRSRSLLRAGAGTLGSGALAAGLAEKVFGGIGPDGAHTSPGWLALIVALMSLPFGLMLFVLGTARWLRSRRRG
jgi:hypothetical protein